MEVRHGDDHDDQNHEEDHQGRTEEGTGGEADDRDEAGGTEEDSAAHDRPEGRLVSFLRSSLGTIEDATLSVGGNALGSIPGLPKGATDKMKSAHSSVIRGTSDRIESVTVGSATAVGKSLQAMVSPIRKLFR
jgi:hypothetical protein